MLGASCGSPCKFERAYVDPATGHTTCVWNAPSRRSVDAVFRKAKVEPCCVTRVDEVTKVSPGKK